MTFPVPGLILNQLEISQKNQMIQDQKPSTIPHCKIKNTLLICENL